MAKIKSYRDLLVWQRAVDLCVDIYAATNSFPQAENYGLTNQIRRASVSIASNIAEGFGGTNRRFAHYLQVGLGSLAELETQLEIAKRVGYLSDNTYTELTNELTILGKQLNVLRQRVVDATNEHR